MPFNVCGLAVSPLSSPYEQDLGKSVVFLDSCANIESEPLPMCQAWGNSSSLVSVGNSKSPASPVLLLRGHGSLLHLSFHRSLTQQTERAAPIPTLVARHEHHSRKCHGNDGKRLASDFSFLLSFELTSSEGIWQRCTCGGATLSYNCLLYKNLYKMKYV